MAAQTAICAGRSVGFSWSMSASAFEASGPPISKRRSAPSFLASGVLLPLIRAKFWSLSRGPVEGDVVGLEVLRGGVGQAGAAAAS